jgi:hypothetical protein
MPYRDQILEKIIFGQLLFKVFGTGLLIENVMQIGFEVEIELERKQMHS